MTQTTLLDIIFTNLTAALNALTPIKMEKIGWYYKKCSAVDELNVEYVLNSYEYELQKRYNVGPRRVRYVKERLQQLLPPAVIINLPLFNSDAQRVPTLAQKEREEILAAREAELAAEREDLSKIIAEYGFDDEDEE